MPERPFLSVGRLFRAILILALLLVYVSCDATGPKPFESEVVVESYQIAGEPAAPVRLTQSIPIDSTYDINDVAVRGADVRIEKLGEGGEVEGTIPYTSDPDSAGFYRPSTAIDGSIPTIEPLGTYRLRVVTEAGAQIRAETTVPDTFSIVSASRDTATYRADEEIAFRITSSRTPGRDQAFYIFSTESLDPRKENLVPLVADFLEQSENSVLSDFVITSSPVLNEAGYTQNADGTLTLRLPWVVVTFYGPNRTRINVLDENMYDFIRSQTAQQGGGGFTPGSIPNVLEVVEGGAGIFGSMASVRREMYVARP
ncbi:hypothetical protein CRI94_07345 [Longibacter salinarum]|uniref:DUF4249 domain-containing protein n=1 Tax=Longibacter salinarum TaxID=1850348 RepID=A0A2A8CYY4_9BACT|nr:DUF4249 family protein [Longibacter salinarum]PEN13866.1 hypothetical protein CRI94_07345 [Longibacter salinarum]